MERKRSVRDATTGRTFNAQAFPDVPGISKKAVKYRRGATIYTPGDACEHVLYIQNGGVKLSVPTQTGKEAVVATLRPGDFFGEGCLVGQPVRMGRATAITPCLIVPVLRDTMVRLLHSQHALSARFIAHMLERNIRIEADLVDRLFNSCGNRVARAAAAGALREAGQATTDRAEDR